MAEQSPVPLRDLRSSFEFDTLEKLLDFSTPTTNNNNNNNNAPGNKAAASHAIATNLDEAFDGGASDEIHEYLNDIPRMKRWLCGVWSSSQILCSMSERFTPNREFRPVFSSCSECTENDSSGGGQQEVHQLVQDQDSTLERILQRKLHELNIGLSVLCSLVARQDSDKLVDLFFTATNDDLWPPEADLIGVPRQIENEDDNKPFVGRLVLFMAEKATSVAFPTARRLSVSLMSMIICRRPTLVFSERRESDFNNKLILYAYRGTIQSLVTDLAVRLCDGDLVGVFREFIGFLNCVPALFCMGVVRDRRDDGDDDSSAFPGMVSYVLRFLDLSVRFPRLWERLDGDMARHPDLNCTPVAMKPFLLRDGEDAERRSWRIRLLENRVCLFAPAVALELLGWLVYNDHSLLEREYVNISEGRDFTVSALVSEHSEAMRRIQNETDDLAYTGSILNELSAGNVPALPPVDKSLLRGPLLDANRRCGLLSCRSPTGLDGGDLLRCAGGCRGLEQYCCKEHQREDWGRHKIFCKGNQ